MSIRASGRRTSILKRWNARKWKYPQHNNNERWCARCGRKNWANAQHRIKKLQSGEWVCSVCVPDQQPKRNSKIRWVKAEKQDNTPAPIQRKGQFGTPLSKIRKIHQWGKNQKNIRPAEARPSEPKPAAVRRRSGVDHGFSESLWAGQDHLLPVKPIPKQVRLSGTTQVAGDPGGTGRKAEVPQ